jgi:hypothetical protein
MSERNRVRYEKEKDLKLVEWQIILIIVGGLLFLIAMVFGARKLYRQKEQPYQQING